MKIEKRWILIVIILVILSIVGYISYQTREAPKCNQKSILQIAQEEAGWCLQIDWEDKGTFWKVSCGPISHPPSGYICEIEMRTCKATCRYII
jgi:hypothetical protein